VELTVLTEQELLAQIVEVSGDAIFSEDLDGKITTWNRAAERLYGCPAADMLGRSTADLLPAKTAAQLRGAHGIALSVSAWTASTPSTSASTAPTSPCP
jgi:PAS domain S-box-containing protein